MKKKGCLITLVVACCLPLLLMLPFIVSPIQHNIALARFSRQLSVYPVPEASEKIDFQKVCGKLNGNGNGMDFAAVLVIRSDKTAEEIQRHYEQKRFESAMSARHRMYGGTVYPPEVIVEELAGNRVESAYLAHAAIRVALPEEECGTYYTVILYDGGYHASWDLRGH